MNRGRRASRAHLLCGAAICAVIAMSGAANAQDAGPIKIPSQSLATALNSFGVQTGRPVMFKPELAAGKQSRAVDSAGDPELALNEMLSGTGLSWRRDGELFLIEKAAADPQSGSAAGDGADSGTVEALIVTAQKREEDIQDVPIAISAFTQEALERSQVAGGPDLMTQVPNMTFTKTNFTGYSIQLRGVGTQAISATTDAAVAVSFNNTSFIRNRFFEQEFYDLQRVEVLRGPQGTLYGRNATAGVVNLISQKPKFAYEAKVVGDIANYSSTRLEGMINVPLVEDKVALRLAGAWTKREGYSTNEITGNPIDGRDLWSSRLSLRFAPTDALDVNLIWEHFEENDDRLRSGKQLCQTDDRTELGPVNDRITLLWTGYSNNLSQGCLAASLYSPDSFEVPNGYSLPYYRPLYELGAPVKYNFNPYTSVVQSRDLRVIESTVDPKYRANSDLVELQWSYDLSHSLSLASETAYSSDTIYSLEDYNRFNTASGAFDEIGWYSARGVYTQPGPNGFPEFCDPQIGCADRVVAMDVSSAKSSQFSQEFRLSSDYDGAFNFSLGANYLRYDTEDKYYVFINTITMANLAAAQGVFGELRPWGEVGVDNSECLPNGAAPPDPTTYAVLRGCVYIDPNPIDSVNDRGHNYFLSRNPYKLISYAVFGEGYWNLTEDLKVTAGLRITRDRKQAPRIPSWLLAARSVGLSVLAVENQEWTEPTGRLAVDWKPALAFTDETLLYASYSRGYKAGGSNPPPAGVVAWGFAGTDLPEAAIKVDETAAKPKIFDPEYVNAFEVGAKNTLLEGKLTLNLAVFYYDYTGYQISQIIDRSAVNYNFDSEMWGLELEADWRPLDNLRLGLKAGYENTRIGDGERAIDIMDRTGGHDDWVVVRPFPSYPSSCVFPYYVLDPDGDGVGDLSASGGYVGACERAYNFGQDPLTGLEYVANPKVRMGGFGLEPVPESWAGYPGFDPDSAPNHGEGFFKDISGNELPNAPHFTGTLTADYTLPLANEWLATLHADLYYQSEAWTRVFNTEGYDKLKAYTNVNVAAIFTNEERGWKVMAYVKNVFDRDSITGAFLNSDDTGLTTNVFLTEPRLYGLRVTKDFDGGPWWTGASGKGPYALWVELGGTVARQDAPYETIAPSVFGTFPEPLAPSTAQNRDLDWGDQREVALAWQAPGQPWRVMASFRAGDANGGTTYDHRSAPAGPMMCSIPVELLEDGECKYYFSQMTGTIWSDSEAREEAEHTLVDFSVGRDLGLGDGVGIRSSLSAGLRYGAFASRTSTVLDGVPSQNVPNGWSFKYGDFDRFRTTAKASRKFEGLGPVVSWDGAKSLLGSEETGHLNVDMSVAAGVMFGRQRTRLTEQSSQFHFEGKFDPFNDVGRLLVDSPPVSQARSESATVPLVDLSLGLSYEIQRVKISAGYRWERYFDVLDAGYEKARDYDQTIDGPYFKFAVGFGG